MNTTSIPDAHLGIPYDFKHTPLEALRGVFVGFCQGLFAAAPHGMYHWDADDAVTEIVIRDEGTIKDVVMQRRPLITITRGPMQMFGIGLDDVTAYDADIDRKTKIVLVPGTMTINCCSRVVVEADNIAWVVFEHLWLLRDLLIRAGIFEVGRSLAIGAPSPAGAIIANDSGDEWVCTPVSVPLQLSRKGAVTPLNKKVLSNIELRTNPHIDSMRSLAHTKTHPGAIAVELSGLTKAVPALTHALDARGRTPAYVGDGGNLIKQRPAVDPNRYINISTPRITGIR